MKPLVKTIAKPAFWVTNASPRNVTLADLAINIKAYTTVNLLDEKHYQLNLEQLQKSATSGSIFKKRDKIVVRHLPPDVPEDKMLFSKEAVIPSRQRSILVIEEKNYEELNVTDEEFAKETVEMDEQKTTKNTTVK
jgi:hypothetical protein